MTAKAQERGMTAASMVGEAATAVGETAGSLASVIRDHAPHEGTLASAATTVAGGLDSVSSYLQAKGYEHLATDLTAVIRRYPVQSLLVGLGLGSVLARMTGETVETIKHTIDVPYQVEQHPWLMVGGATLAGYLLGSWGSGSPSPTFSTNDSAASAAGTTLEMAASHARQDGLPLAAGASSGHPQRQQGMGSSDLEPLKDDIAISKVAAVGALVSTLREVVNQVVPTLAPHLERARSHRGGQPRASPTQHPAPMPRTGVNGIAI